MKCINQPFSVAAKKLGFWIIAAVVTLCLPVNGATTELEVGKLYHDLFSVSFPTEEKGWACGRRGTILHTDDGGGTWIRQRSGTVLTLSGIHFFDSMNGIAVGQEGTILRTEDGGKNWTKEKSPVDYFLMDVHCLSASKAVIVTERTHILQSEDGGKKWTVIFKDKDFILKALSFYDERNGWAVGEYGYIYHTDDGGANWKNQAGQYGFSQETGELIGDKYLFDVMALSQKEVWAVGIDGCVKKSVDGGEVWVEVLSGAPKTHLYCIVSDREKGIFIGGKGVLLASYDSGRHWKKVVCEPSVVYGWLYGADSRKTGDLITVGCRGDVYRSGEETWRKITY